MTTEKEIYINNETVAYNDGYDDGYEEGIKQLAEDILRNYDKGDLKQMFNFQLEITLYEKLQKAVEGK
jgi:hypothetical protein